MTPARVKTLARLRTLFLSNVEFRTRLDSAPRLRNASASTKPPRLRANFSSPNLHKDLGCC
eukprot:6306326-Lingulodinium_polyedra.AAC.1